VKFIIAPHNIKQEQIDSLYKQIKISKFKYSDYSIETLRKPNLKNYQVFIIDTIGLLTKIYSYADIAYVGGGFGNPGVHNILEPATFGLPIIIGPNYAHFAEATALVNMEGCISISNYRELKDSFNLLLQNEDERLEKGHICSTFVQMNKGATNIIINHLIN
jgi:3-deoxy-D-manno-octulosonic-acid transferase